MDKRQQLIVGVIAVIAAAAIGSVVYMQFATVPGTPSLGSVAPTTVPNGTVSEATNGSGFSEPSVPVGDLSANDIAEGISDDLLREDAVVDADVDAETSDVSGSADSLKDLENSYEEGGI